MPNIICVGVYLGEQHCLTSGGNCDNIFMTKGVPECCNIYHSLIFPLNTKNMLIRAQLKVPMKRK